MSACINRRIWAWLFLFVLAVAPFNDISAQAHVPSFDDLAADAAAARDVDDVPRSIHLYKQALRLNPNWQDGWLSLGLLQYGFGFFESATDALSHALVLNPKSGQALALRGLCEFQTADYKRSLADIQHSFAFGAADDPQHEQILRYHEAMLLTRLGRYQEALKVYSVFAQHKISNPQLLMAIGLAALRMPLLPRDAPEHDKELLTEAGEATFDFQAGDESAAQADFAELFQQFPTARNAHLLYGNLLSASDADAAIREFKKELQIAPDNVDALSLLAWSLLMQNRPGEALPLAKRVEHEQPERAASQLVLGRALVDTGNAMEAIPHLQRALKLQPHNLEVHLALAKAYSESGRDVDARQQRILCLQMTQNGATGLAHP